METTIAIFISAPLVMDRKESKGDEKKGLLFGSNYMR